MEKSFLSRIAESIKRSRRNKTWKKVVTVLACVVVFCTTYALILPAITMENKTYCGNKEHKHTDACYEKTLVCQIDESTSEITGHTHSAECYTQEKHLICTEQSHVHTEACKSIERELNCELEENEEHTHDESCYIEKETFTCGQEEQEHVHIDSCYEIEEILSCGQEETTVQTASHEHTEDCYKTVLVCEQEEHIHSLACYADKTADLEKASDWEATLPDELTGIWSEDILLVAQSQIGYEESAKNYEVSDGNDEKKGYTRYGDWYGNSYGDWCAMFASFCLNYADIPQADFPYEAGCQRWIEKLTDKGLYALADEYTPKPGDLVFFEVSKKNVANHVGIVMSVTEDTIKTIEGNSGDKVRTVTYKIDDEDILGYGVLPENPDTPVTELVAAIYTDDTYSEIDKSDDTIISISGRFTEKLTAKAYPVEVAAGQQVLCAYDISLFREDGSIYEPDKNNPVTVEFQSAKLTEDSLTEMQTEEGKTPSPEVYYIPESGNPEALDTTVDDGKVVFEAEHFSVYAVMLAADATEVTTQTELKNAIESATADVIVQLKNSMGVYIDSNTIDTYGYIDGPIQVRDGANVTLDLNGKNLWHYGIDALFAIPEGATLTIIDSGITDDSATTTLTDVSETITDGTLYGNEATVSVTNNVATLTYYVTTSEITDASTGATKETLVKHTVTAQNAIVASNNPVFSVTGGTLNIASGMIRSGTARAINQTSGIVNMSGGYICGFTLEGEKTVRGGAVVTTGGTFNLSDTAVIAANSAPCGGGLYANGGAVNITGGVISGNIASCTTTSNEWTGEHAGGGGIYCSGSTITMSDGFITNNIGLAAGYFDGGGGVLVEGTSVFNMQGGYVTGNEAEGGGGIRIGRHQSNSVVYMTGGYICSNAARTAEGGGVSVDRAGTMTIIGSVSSRCYINNNIVIESPHWGGGGLFCADGGGTINITNLLVTNNSAGGFGGGIAGCSTGHIYLYVDHGCAIYDNDDVVNYDGTELESPHFTGSASAKQKDSELCDSFFQAHGHEDYFCALQSTVTGMALGGGATNWSGTADGMACSTTATTDILTATNVMGLKSDLSTSSKTAAEEAAYVYVNGNYSYTHGGGILCNGNLVIGNPTDITVPVHFEVRATKAFLNTSGNSVSLDGNTFRFILEDENNVQLATGTCDSDGNVTFNYNMTFGSTEKESDYPKQFVYYIYEDRSSETSDIQLDETRYKITVSVQLNAGETWYGSTKKYSYEIVSILVQKDQWNNETNTWDENWITVLNDTSTHTDNYILNVEDEIGAAFKNYKVDGINVKVVKKWVGASQDSVTVTLYRNGEVYETAVLNDENSWTYQWNDLLTKDDSGNDYSYYVREEQISGYVTEYTVTSESETNSVAAWVPADSLEVGEKYIIVNQAGDRALMISSAHEDHGFDSTDQASVTEKTGSLTIGNVTYTSWYETGIDARCTFTAYETTKTKDNVKYSGIILKNNGTTADTWLLVQSADDTYLKSTSRENYSSIITYEDGLLKGQDGYNWNSSTLRTLIYENNEFNTSTSTTNAVKLYKYVSSNTMTVSSTTTITNTSIDNMRFKLDITKVSREDNEVTLAGAQFELLDSDGKKLAFTGSEGAYERVETETSGSTTTVTTIEGGKLTLTGIPAGTYTLHEIKAPEGYGLIEDITITLDDSSEPTVSIVVEDPIMQYELPNTGGMGTNMFTIGGILLMGASLFTGYSLRRKNGRRLKRN